jgi:ABC-type dipeptide/oligopeptide/nickel transport system ATPase component|tara:strand:+ start:478 stop:1323 length:846 start_codon:yes stop_codon:yes gene_type:complete
METKKDPYWISPITKDQLKTIKIAVTKKDRDYVFVIDGEEGSGKSVLAQQLAKELDPNFNIDNICFNADQFISRLKTAPKYSCIILDEAFSSANSRSALTEVNRSLIGIATEMRQRNLFVIIVIPSFFDLDKYFALWRCRSLFHTYFKKDGSRGSYIIFPKNKKKYLYLNGKKFYNYSKPSSPYPVCSFTNYYTVNEMEYRKKKSDAFQKRAVSNLARRWKLQRDALIKELYHNKRVGSSQFEKIFLNFGAKPVSQREIQRLVQLFGIEDPKKDLSEEFPK